MLEVVGVSRKIKFRLRIDTKLLSAATRVVARRRITVNEFGTEVMERGLKEETEEKMSTNRVVQLGKKAPAADDGRCESRSNPRGRDKPPPYKHTAVCERRILGGGGGI
jgi:hypothetical protein